MIYNFVFLLDLDYQPTILQVDRISLDKLPDQTLDELVIETTSSTKAIPRVAWLDLVLTCRTIACELKLHMRSQSYLRSKQNRSYVLRLERAKGVRMSSHAQVRWRKLPCPPQLVEKLTVHVHRASKETMAALNLFMHCGPQMNRSRALQSHLAIPKLLVRLHPVKGASRPGRTPERALLDDIFQNLEAEHDVVHSIKKLNETGMLDGFFHRMSVKSECGRYKFVVAQPCQQPRIPAMDWGLGEEQGARVVMGETISWLSRDIELLPPQEYGHARAH